MTPPSNSPQAGSQPSRSPQPVSRPLGRALGPALRELRGIVASLARPLARPTADGAGELPVGAPAPGTAEGRDDVHLPSAAALAAELAARVLERLDRDLCPRTAGGSEHLVVGIVGPNNAGKSALFNALVGDGHISPSRATGGATRRLVGAVHPELRRRLESEPSLARFPMRGVTPRPDGVLEALETGANPAELLLVETERLPEDLLLVDTPDFDSVLRTNREVAAALLCVADVAVAVVTRHTYQNRDVVEFLRTWLAHERPWVLVYNEAFEPDVTARHAATLAAGVGAPPVAVFAAPHSAAVARGEAPLVPRALAGGTSLSEWLRDQGEARALKEQALRASLAQLESDLVDLVRLLTEDADRAQRILDLVRARSGEFGREVARGTMPAAVFLTAFRDVLDRRPTAVQRRLRSGLRWTGRQVEAGARWVGRKLGTATQAPSAPTAASIEGAALAARWTPYHEALVRSLRPARDEARDADQELHAALAADLGAPSSAALARAGEAARRSELGLEEFARTCEVLVEKELERGGLEWVLQLGVDALHLLPAVAAGAVILHTGGLGADVAVAGGGALSSVLAERLSRLLGSGVAREARERWAETRGTDLADAAARALLPATLPLLERRAEARRELATRLDRWLRETPRMGEAHAEIEGHGAEERRP